MRGSVETECVRIVKVGAAAMVLVAGLASCSTGDSSAGAGGPSAEPDITSLTDSLLLPEADFPALGDGRCEGGKIMTMDAGDVEGSKDSEKYVDVSRRVGDQFGNRICSGKGYSVSSAVNNAAQKMDLSSWAAKELPQHGHLPGTAWVTTLIDAPGLPSGVIAMQSTVRGELSSVVAWGRVRGVNIDVNVGIDSGASKDQAVQYMVTVFNRQADRIRAA